MSDATSAAVGKHSSCAAHHCQYAMHMHSCKVIIKTCVTWGTVCMCAHCGEDM